MDMSTVRRWVMGFTNDDSDVRHKPCSGGPVQISTHEMFIADKNDGGVETCTIHRGYCARSVYCSCRRIK